MGDFKANSQERSALTCGVRGLKNQLSWERQEKARGMTKGRKDLNIRADSADLGRARLEEPVEAESPRGTDGGLELVPGAVAKLMHHAQDEAVFLLCINAQACQLII